MRPDTSFIVTVAHGSWIPAPGKGSFFLWGETSSGGSPQRRRSKAGLPLHPFHSSRKQVEQGIFRQLEEDRRKTEFSKAEAVYLLPTVNGRPVPSPELVAEEIPHSGVRRSLSLWRITGLALSSVTALGWLAGLPSDVDSFPVRLRIGADLRFWATASRLALEILARQRFLPDVEVRRRSRVFSRWSPLLDEEHERIERLVAAMPPVCRAIVHGKQTKTLEPEILVRSFLTAVVDGFVRQAASRLRLSPRTVDTEGARFAAALLEPDDGALFLPKDVILSLIEDLTDWKQFIDEETETPFRIAFRLEPPEEAIDQPNPGDLDTWTLRYFLQAVDDPSLLVPLALIWQHSGATWRHLHRRMDRPQERVLEGLSRASSLLPLIEESLKESRPEYCRMTLEEAYKFLRESSCLLQESGFGVLVPSWWGNQECGLGLKLRCAPAADPGRISAGIGLDAIVEFDWQVALGAESLDRKEFLKLVELKQPLVRVRGRWVELKSSQVEEALSVFRARPSDAKMHLRDVLQLRLGPRGESRLPVTDIDAQGWVEDFLEKIAGSEPQPPIEQPRGFQGQLRPYQVRGLAWLVFMVRWGLGACLADDMGLGKTIQVLALLLHLKEEKRLDRPFLLICPTSVVSNWRKESERFAPSLRVLIHHGLGRHGGQSFERETERNDLVISTYSLVHRDLEQIAAVQWTGLVLDEAQNIKNPSAKQTQAVRHLVTPARISLTGTPVENRLSELWSIMEFLNPGYLGSELSFKRRFSVPIERYHDREVSDALHRQVKPFVLRRLKTDPRVIEDLPEKNEMKVYCSLTREQATLYEAIVRESLKHFDDAKGIGRKGAVLSALTRLKQVCNHPAHYLADNSRLDGRSGKLTRLTEMLEEVLAEGDCALVFTQFAKMGEILRRHLREILSVEVAFLHGGVPARQREKIISRFQEEPSGPSIFVLSLKAGGFGLNLTRARHVFHFDRWWNPAVEDQATDRVFRIGQTRPVAVYKYVCTGTVEEKIDALIEKKKELAGVVIRAAEESLTELSTADLRDLLTLRSEAVQE